jgi:hypothetical protein
MNNSALHPRERKGLGVTRTSALGTRGVLEWILEAHRADRVWYRNALIVIAILTGLLLLALKWGSC